MTTKAVAGMKCFGNITAVVGVLALLSTGSASQAQSNTFSYDGILQTFTIPTSGIYDITAWGAQGGNDSTYGYSGGNGAEIGGDVSLTAGTVLTILVGGKASDAPASGGGGGSFVVVESSGLPLVIAGGGGGAGSFEGGGYASLGDGDGGVTGSSGGSGNSIDPPGPAGGSGGSGGGNSSYDAGGGGGFSGNGTSGADPNTGGFSYSNGGAGGAVAGPNGSAGGFGGGGGGGAADGGGGGGYSGGGSGYGGGGAGGGGSYLDSSVTEEVSTGGENSGNGKVGINLVAAVPEPGSPGLLAGGLVILALCRQRTARCLRRGERRAAGMSV